MSISAAVSINKGKMISNIFLSSWNKSLQSNVDKNQVFKILACIVSKGLLTVVKSFINKWWSSQARQSYIGCMAFLERRISSYADFTHVDSRVRSLSRTWENSTWYVQPFIKPPTNSQLRVTRVNIVLLTSDCMVIRLRRRYQNLSITILARYIQWWLDRTRTHNIISVPCPKLCMLYI